MSDMGQYASYFSAGMKIGVGIPLPDAGVFHDWAKIHEVDEDLVTLQLSRDQLPDGVSLDVGQIVDLRGGKDDTAYSCRAIIVSEGRARKLLLRLIGEIVTDELREFYRIDAFLPVKYYISPDQRPEYLKKEWTARRSKRLNDVLLRRQQRWDSIYSAGNADLPPERRQELLAAEPDEYDPSWDTIVPLAASISGGGIRIVTHHGFEVGQYVPLEIMVPLPHRIVDIVGRVVFVTPKSGAPDDRESYNVAMKFVFIHELDRDVIVSHIANVQLKRIRQLREQFALREADGESGGGATNARTRWSTIIRNTFYVFVVLAVWLMLFDYFRDYSLNRPKSEIEETFEKGIRKYKEKLGR